MIQFAIASRTKSIEWAHDLLRQFHIEIVPADKKPHFRNLHQKRRIPYENMIFLDDARGGKFGNCVSVAELRVLDVHCPGGLPGTDLFQKALSHYQNTNTDDDDSYKATKTAIIESNGTMTYINSGTTSVTTQKRINDKSNRRACSGSVSQ